MKLYKRSVLLRNYSIFLIFSLFFIHIVISLSEGVSAINYVSFINFINDKWWLLFLLSFSLYTVFWMKRSSRLILILFFFAVMQSSIHPFLKTFDKGILILNFIYIIFFFFFYIFWDLELEESVYQPGFNIYNIDVRSQYNLNVEIEGVSGKKYLGYLTNWDDLGCFLYIGNYSSQIRGKIRLSINYEGLLFSQRGFVVTKYGNGVGVKFADEEPQKNSFGWKEFFEIINERGFTPLNKLRT